MSTTHRCQTLPNLREDGQGELNMLSIVSWISGPVWARTTEEMATDIPSEQKADRYGQDPFELIAICLDFVGGHKAACHHQKEGGVSCCWD